MMNIYEDMSAALKTLDMQGLLRSLPDTGARHGAKMEFGGRNMLNLSSNDYLGIASDRVLKEEYLDKCHRYSQDYWMSSSSSRLLTGNHPLYAALEQRLAGLYGREAALVFNSGYHANTGILPALAGRHDLILSDRLNHASIYDGAAISRAELRRYRHLDYQHLESLLEGAGERYRQVFIVTESVFSMDGDCADLKQLVQLRNTYNAMLIVDEAHGAGTFGKLGLGLAEHQGQPEGIDIVVGTFGKALASAGAYAVMDALTRDYLVNTMRPLIFTTALPPVVLGWSLMVLEKQTGMEAERARLQELGRYLRSEISDRGFEVYGQSHIVPVVLGSNDAAVAAADRLREQGVLVLPVRPPTVPENSARLRFSLRSDLAWEDIERVPELLSPGGGR
jgi:8-amino-7-oxononanoate synthase